MPLNDAELATQQGGIEKQLETVQAREQAVSGERAQLLEQKQQALAGPTQSAIAESQRLAEKADEPLPESEASKVEFKPHEVDKESLTKFAWGALAAALVGGAVSKGNWLGVSSALNGAMKGYFQGDKDRAAKEYEDFKTKFDVAQKHDKEAADKMKEALENRKLSLNAKLQQVRLIANEYDVPDMRAAAELKSLDAASNQLQAHIEKIENMRVRMDDVQKNLDAKLKRDTADPGLPQGFDQKDIDFYALQQLSGHTDWRMGLSRTKRGADIIAAVDARIPKLAEQYGITGAQAGTILDVRKSLDKALTDRQKSLAASTQFIAQLDGQMAIVEKYLQPGVGGATPAFNRWIQAGRQAIEGDPDVVALSNAISGLGREHQRLVTGVTSNSQLTDAAKKTADELTSKDMTVEQVRASMREMKEEGQNAVKAGQQEVGNLTYQLSHLVPDQAPQTPAATGGKPKTDDELDKAYGIH